MLVTLNVILSLSLSWQCTCSYLWSVCSSCSKPSTTRRIWTWVRVSTWSLICGLTSSFLCNRETGARSTRDNLMRTARLPRAWSMWTTEGPSTKVAPHQGLHRLRTGRSTKKPTKHTLNCPLAQLHMKSEKMTTTTTSQLRKWPIVENCCAPRPTDSSQVEDCVPFLPSPLTRPRVLESPVFFGARLKHSIESAEGITPSRLLAWWAFLERT